MRFPNSYAAMINGAKPAKKPKYSCHGSMPASRRESENAVGSYDVDVVVVNIAVVVAVSMTSLSSAAARVEIFRHLFLLLLLVLAREGKDNDDARKREAQKWHSRRLRVVILFGGATAARADIARMICVLY